MKVSTPDLTAPPDSLVMTFPRSHPSFVPSYQTIFNPDDWASRLDSHAEIAMSLQTDVSGLRVLGVEAVEGAVPDTIDIVTSCRCTVCEVGSDGKVHSICIEFGLRFAHESKNSDIVTMVNYEPRSLESLSDEEVKEIGRLSERLSFEKEWLFSFYGFLYGSLHDALTARLASTNNLRNGTIFDLDTVPDVTMGS
ncbi:hypothetical protein VNI00_018498 [Paramarasmius palmivorus]|uniref:Uncharacterized protein n=1 Tax=Paramarasmius palmivorus TaxID=297713 RepID=A0AAW0AWM7_9AGAR